MCKKFHKWLSTMLKLYLNKGSWPHHIDWKIKFVDDPLSLVVEAIGQPAQETKNQKNREHYLVVANKKSQPYKQSVCSLDVADFETRGQPLRQWMMTIYRIAECCDCPRRAICKWHRVVHVCSTLHNPCAGWWLADALSFDLCLFNQHGLKLTQYDAAVRVSLLRDVNF